MKIDTTHWKDYRISELFDSFQTGKGNDVLLEDGNDCIYIGAKWNDNGVMRRCLKNPDLLQDGNCVVFICNGEGSVGFAIYLDREFIATTDVVAGYSKHLTPNIGLFIATIASFERPKYSHGRKWKTHLKNTTLKLPHDSDGNPNWKWMDGYIKNLHYKSITTTNKKIENQLNIQDWGTFQLKDLFIIERGDRIVHNVDYFDNMDGENIYPVITAKTTNNGVDGYYSSINCNGNCLISGGEASGMFTTYQKDPCWALDRVRVYDFKDKSIILNKYIGLFLATILNQHMFRYSYGRSANPDNMYPLDIKLPVTKEGKPDWKYMEEYIKSLPYGDRI